MKKQYSVETRSSVKCLAVALMIAGMFLNSACSVAQEPIPFNALMQSAGANTPVPPMPGANPASGQKANPAHITHGGKTEIAVGFVLLGAGIVTIAATALVSSSGFKPQGGKTPALYAGGAGVAAVGVALVAIGFHKRSAK